ncbi:MAG TPA: VCBS repeat-containing protein [Phycisphaerales bacterium]|nr:VCBS repeat-containing protein [Phycisphaerales bacterium]
MSIRSIMIAACAGLPACALAQPQFSVSPHQASLIGERFLGSGIALADVTGDGLLDVVVSDNTYQQPYTHQFSVLVNLGSGQFASAVVSMPVTEGNDFSNLALALGDLNEDGRADLVTTRLSTFYPPDGNRPNLAVMFGNADGSFSGQVNLANSTTDRFMRQARGKNVAIGDMNGDGHLDIVSVAANDSFSVIRGNGDGTFQPPIQSGAGYAQITTLGDLDADGDLDVVGFWGNTSSSRPVTTVIVNFNNGQGVLTGAPTTSLGARINGGHCMALVRDLNGDNKADLAFFGERGAESGAGGIYLYAGNGTGAFPTVLFRETRAEDNLDTSTCLLDDFDGDGDQDLLKYPAPGRTGEVRLNNGSGDFSSVAPLTAGSVQEWTGASGDLLGHGLPDLAFYQILDGSNTPTIQVLENVTPLPGPSCDSIDFNGDGLFPDNADLEDFFSVFGGGPCSTGTCNDIDFNNDGLFPDNDDLEDYLRVFGGGSC